MSGGGSLLLPAGIFLTRLPAGGKGKAAEPVVTSHATFSSIRKPPLRERL